MKVLSPLLTCSKFAVSFACAFLILAALPCVSLASASIEGATVSEISDRYKTGDEIKPLPQVVVGGETLMLHTDYSLSYANNTNVGVGQVTITGKGNYTGQKTVTFNIYGDGGDAVWQRLAGDTRYGTMAKVAQEGFADGSCDVAILATGENFPDALAASSLAGFYDAPILLTSTTSLTNEARAELERLVASKVYVLGGKNSVSDGVLAEVEGMGISAERVAGESRQDTSVKIYEQLLGQNATFDTVIVASGASFADALSISPYACATATPILLTGSDGKLTSEEVKAIKKNGNIRNIIIAGGINAVNGEVESQLAGMNIQRLSGGDRYGTSTKVAEWELSQGMNANNMSAATGDNYPDALTGSALCGKLNSVLILVSDQNRTTVKTVYRPYMTEVDNAYVFGGVDTVSDDTYTHYVTTGGYRIDDSSEFSMTGVTRVHSNGKVCNVISPAGGTDWERDLTSLQHRWKSNDTTATIRSGFSAWDGDEQGKVPSESSAVYIAWWYYQYELDLDRAKYPKMSFSEWVNTYLYEVFYYELIDNRARNDLKRLGMWDDVVSEISTSIDVSEEQYAQRKNPYGDLIETSELTLKAAFESGYYVIGSTWLRTSIDDPEWRMYEDDFIVSYSPYAGTGAFASPSSYRFVHKVDML